jgi:LAS superfamily LD-carboxypeptidase LdcB
MKRKNFLQLTGICGIGVLIFPQIALATSQQSFTREQLMGKGNSDIVGDSYVSTMNTKTKSAFLDMKAAAAKEGIAIEVVSAYRSFERQKEIFEGKYKRFTKQGLTPEAAISKIIEYSTIPGTSRHHWGTDIDIIDANGSPRPSSVLQAAHFHGKGPFCKLKDWLTIHASSYGFYEAYTSNANRKGFEYEPWHFSYAPVSKPMLEAYKKLDIKTILQEENIVGSEYFTDAFIATYRKENILDINPELIF